MTLTHAFLNYPWDGVELVAVDPNKPGDIYMAKRFILPNGSTKTVILSTEGTAEEVYGDMEQKTREVIERMKLEKEKHDVTFRNNTTQAEEPGKPKNPIIDKMKDMEHWDWKPLRSLMPGYNF